MRRIRALALLAVLPLLAHCASAPQLDGIEPSHAIPPATSTALDRAGAFAIAAHREDGAHAEQPAAW